MATADSKWVGWNLYVQYATLIYARLFASSLFSKLDARRRRHRRGGCGRGRGMRVLSLALICMNVLRSRHSNSLKANEYKYNMIDITENGLLFIHHSIESLRAIIRPEIQRIIEMIRTDDPKLTQKYNLYRPHRIEMICFRLGAVYFSIITN